MKKKNLVVLLILPFLISLLGVVTVNVTVRTIEKDILSIDWTYDDVEAFQIKENGTYKLYATAVTENNSPLAQGNELVWSVQNKNKEEEPHAEIIVQAGNSYLKPISEGEVTITCSNEKGNVSRRMSAIIYKDGAIIIQTKIRGSQTNIDDTVYFGEFDFVNGQKSKATIALDIRCAPTSLADTLTVDTLTENIGFDLSTKKISVKNDGDAALTLSSMIGDYKISYTYSFNVVKGGVNVYSYDDLLNCTNRSAEGEIVVLRKSFESISNAYLKRNGVFAISGGQPVKKADNVENFGYYSDYNAADASFDFSKDVYRFKTTYNTEFIRQWNDFAASNSTYKKMSDTLVAGLRVQKDFYGNGYTLNLHNLTYPYEETPRKTDSGTVYIPTLSDKNLFRGALPFYTLGDPHNMPLVSAYGQDNVGLYVDGDNVTVNDVNIKNCDFGSSFSNLKYVGTVLEIGGDNVTVKNSQIANGKNVVRAFSAQNARVQNCILSNAQNFLLFAGSNETLPINETKFYELYSENGTATTSTLKEYLKANGVGDKILTNYLMQQADVAKMKKTLGAIQNALSDRSLLTDAAINMSVHDTLFYRSGVASIAMDTAFNGPFLYSKTPTAIEQIFKMMPTENKNLVPFLATKISGLSIPMNVEVSGATKFYDYKTLDGMDLSGLIEENMSAVISELGNIISIERTITIDDIFPLKKLLFESAGKKGQTYSVDGKTYLNVPVAYYGGGLNLSTVSFTNIENVAEYGETLPLDWINEYLSNSDDVSEDDLSSLKKMVQRMVTVVTGFEEFKFTCMKGNGYLYGKAPNVSELRENIKG